MDASCETLSVFVVEFSKGEKLWTLIYVDSNTPSLFDARI